MDIHITHAMPEEGPRSGPVKVGWLLNEERGGVIYDAPAKVRSAEVNRRHAKSAARCPAILNLESRYVEVTCPFDLHLAFVRDEHGNPGLRNLLGKRSSVRAKKLASVLNVTNEDEWRYPDRPTIQLSLPYVFVSDEPVYLSQVAPFMHYRADPWPGTIFGGRFPIDIWPRPLMWGLRVARHREGPQAFPRRAPLLLPVRDDAPHSADPVDRGRTNAGARQLSRAHLRDGEFREPDLLPVQDRRRTPPQDPGSSQNALTCTSFRPKCFKASAQLVESRMDASVVKHRSHARERLAAQGEFQPVASWLTPVNKYSLLVDGEIALT